MRRTLATALTALAMTPAFAIAQTPETCVAYMEADEAYAESRREAERAHDESYDRIEAMAVGMVGRERYDRARRTGTLTQLFGTLPADRARELDDAATETTRDWREATDRAKRERYDAYLRAYGGPTSNIPRVMTKLLNKDRLRCKLMIR